MSYFLTACKIGTVPKLVWVHEDDELERGRTVRVFCNSKGRPDRHTRDQDREEVEVTEVHDDGYFKGTRI